MVDEYQGAAVEQAEEGQPLPEAGTPAAETAAPEPITKRELEAFKKELTGELLRVIQSQTDKAQSRIKKEVDAKLGQVEATFKELKEAGYSVTEDDLKLARSQALRDVLTASRDQDAAAQPPSGPPIADAKVRETNEAMRQLQKQYGYVLTENDPEFWEVPFQGSAPEDFLAKYEAGLKDVVTRLGRPLPAQAQSVNPVTRTPTPGGTAITGLEGLTAELNRLLENPSQAPADVKRRKELQKEILKHVPTK